MSVPIDDKELDKALAEAFGPSPDADFDAWQRRNPQAIAYLNPLRVSASARRRKQMHRIIGFIATAAAAVCVWLGITHFGTEGPESVVFSQTSQQIQRANTVAWKWTVYEHITSKDGKRTWLKTETREKAYKAPGLYRETFLDEKGQVKEVQITDRVHGKELKLFPQTKEATLSELRAEGPSGPFDWVKKELEDTNLQWVETRKTPAGDVNIFRHAFKDQANGRDWSGDFWIDQKTKRLVEVHCPGADIYDPTKDPARSTPPEKEMSIGTAPGSFHHDIVLDATLDDSLFRLEVPDGYTVKTEHRGQVTEKEIVDYLGVVADFNDKTFPDQVFPFDISSDRVNMAWDKPEKDRTAAEQKLVETVDHYIAKFYSMPISVFIEDHAAPNTFRYLGKGVKLGDKDRIVCWYKLKGAKTYRVVYGDLSVKDVKPEDLPLSVQP